MREQDIGAHSHSYTIPMSFVWDTILESVYKREQDMRAKGHYSLIILMSFHNIRQNITFVSLE